MTTTIPRYLTTYRQDELRQICSHALKGASLCFVGVAGSGKSNVINLLSTDPYGYKSHYLGDAVERVYFPVVAGPTVQRSAQTLWETMTTALKEAAPGVPWPPFDDKIRPISPEQGAYSQLRACVRTVCQDLGRHLMFIVDDFDGVLESGPLVMLEQLAALRNDGNRDYLSYLLFVKRLPHLLGQAHLLQDTSKFYDLFRHHIYALPPYEEADARQMLAFLNSSERQPLDTADFPAIVKLAGGHAGLLRIVFDLWRSALVAGNIETYLGGRSEVQSECRRIFQQLHPEEQQTAVAIAQSHRNEIDRAVVDHLAVRGLLTESGDKITWFSPLFARYLQKVVEVDLVRG
jgi:hypothetical protein